MTNRATAIKDDHQPSTKHGSLVITLIDENATVASANAAKVIELSRKHQEREKLIQSFLQQTTQLSWVVDENAKLIFANNAFYRHFGTTEDACIDKKITEIVPPAIFQNMYEHHRKVIDTLKPTDFTQRVKWADGSNFVSHVNLFPVGMASGKTLVGGQAVYLADHSEVEKELHLAHERILNLSRATSDAIWEWDILSGQIVQNERLLEMTGFNQHHSKGLAGWLRQIHRRRPE